MRPDDMMEAVDDVIEVTDEMIEAADRKHHAKVFIL
jgi:hypothetical protein